LGIVDANAQQSVLLARRREAKHARTQAVICKGPIERYAVGADHRDQHGVRARSADRFQTRRMIVAAERNVVDAQYLAAGGLDVAARSAMRHVRPHIVVADEIPAPDAAMLSEPMDRWF